MKRPRSKYRARSRGEIDHIVHLPSFQVLIIIFFFTHINWFSDVLLTTMCKNEKRGKERIHHVCLCTLRACELTLGQSEATAFWTEMFLEWLRRRERGCFFIFLYIEGKNTLSSLQFLSHIDLLFFFYCKRFF